MIEKVLAFALVVVVVGFLALTLLSGFGIGHPELGLFVALVAGLTVALRRTKRRT